MMNAVCQLFRLDSCREFQPSADLSALAALKQLRALKLDYYRGDSAFLRDLPLKTLLVKTDTVDLDDLPATLETLELWCAQLDPADLPKLRRLTNLKTIHVPEEFKPYVNDYKVNLFEIAYLTDEQVNLFKSDFRVVAEYFTQMQRNRDYKPEPRTLVHVQEVLQLLSIMTGDHRFEEVFASGTEGGPENMCEVLDRIEKRGEEKKAASLTAAMRSIGLTEEQIAEIVRISRETDSQNVRSIGLD